MNTRIHTRTTSPAARSVPPSGTMTSPTPTTPSADTLPAIESRWLLDIPQACAALHVSRAALFRLLAAGDLLGIKIGRRRLLPVASIESYIRQRILEEGGDAA